MKEINATVCRHWATGSTGASPIWNAEQLHISPVGPAWAPAEKDLAENVFALSLEDRLEFRSHGAWGRSQAQKFTSLHGSLLSLWWAPGPYIGCISLELHKGQSGCQTQDQRAGGQQPVPLSVLAKDGEKLLFWPASILICCGIYLKRPPKLVCWRLESKSSSVQKRLLGSDWLSRALLSAVASSFDGLGGLPAEGSRCFGKCAQGYIV